MDGIFAFLCSNARDGHIVWSDQVEASQIFGLSLAEVERVALENELLPARYQRNRKMINCRQQLQLFDSVVAVIGCGGLGGYIIEELARLGVGTIIAIDPDKFEEHNLNRQLLSSPEVLGQVKVEITAQRIAQVNPAVNLIPICEHFTHENGLALLKGASIAVDGLDSIPSRLALAAVCAEAGIPLVHGAIAGWYGQVAIQFPGEETINKLYKEQGGRGIEGGLGNPSFTPAVVASLEVAEVCKVILKEGEPLRGRSLMIDLREMEFIETLSG